MEPERSQAVYNDKVHVTDWQRVYEGFPFDVEPKKGEAHYRTWGSNAGFYVTKSSAHEAMEIGSQKIGDSRAVRRSTLNFTSFPIIDGIVRKELDKGDKIEIPVQPLTSTYKRDYTKEYNKKPLNLCEAPHFLFNRIPRNDLLMMSASAPHKFMDTHLYQDREQGKLCINYMRQMRTASNIFNLNNNIKKCEDIKETEPIESVECTTEPTESTEPAE